MESYTTAARGIVEEGVSRSGTPLSPPLFENLTRAVSRVFTGVAPEMMSLRYFRVVETGAKRSEVLAIGDDCLLACGMFPERIIKTGGSVNHYAGLGRTAYDEIGLSEAASGFPHMVSVLSSLAPDRDQDVLIKLALVGAESAKKELSSGNVILFRKR